MKTPRSFQKNVCKNSNRSVSISNAKSQSPQCLYPENEGDIRCYCLLNSEDSDMLHCDSCCHWLHTVCCGFLSNSDKRIPKDEFICLYCRRTVARDDAYKALFRRLLSIVYSEGLESKAWLSSRTGASKWRVSRHVDRMVYEGFVKIVQRSGSPSYETVKTQEVKEKIKAHFRADSESSAPPSLMSDRQTSYK